MELSPQYDPSKVEERIYRRWLAEGLFRASPDSPKTPYVIVIPPPNVTGVLHMGHGLNNTVQDILIRWKKMQGYETCWVPGTDHAGIATQNVVEKKLRKERGLTRHQISREEFVAEVWKWKEEHGSTIIRQLKRIGASCDWDRERFTMDEGLSRAVQEVFVRLYEEGLIYRGEYLVNWCPRCGTALSDEEAEHKEKDGHLWYFRYPVKGSDESVVVATTRPETMLGDTAVAVHPDDPRYRHLHGRKVVLPLVGREIPVITDTLVDPEFGTGCVKVTPAHDPNDFLMAERHGLPKVDVMTPDGRMNDAVPEAYRGLDRFECRKRVVADLKTLGHFVKEERHRHAVGHCYRCETVVEPRLSKQWFVRMRPLAEPAIRAVEEGRIVFTPDRWRKVYLNWMRNIRDWCISRQIWWGHRIPAWFCACGEVVVARTPPARCPKCGGTDLRQDEDVLDTWFSSWLWPFSVFGWPERTKELERFYPTSTLVTDPGIIFFWVARMIMAGLHFMGDIPFRDVFLNGTVMDSQGRKMSKSLGNGIDPLEVVEEYGADALRYTIVSIAPAGENVLLSKDKFRIGQAFANKVWNAGRYILQTTREHAGRRVEEFLGELGVADKWILDGLQGTVRKVTEHMGRFEFNEVCRLLHEFFWRRFCDWYIEVSKTEKGPRTAAVLRHVLGECLKLMHPVMPFVTEELWSYLRPEAGSLLRQAWPEPDDRFVFPAEREAFEYIGRVVYHIRNIRGEMGIEPSKRIDVVVRCASAEKLGLLEAYAGHVRFLAAVEGITAGPDVAKPEPASVAAVDEETEVFVPLKGNVDLGKERQRLEKEIAKLTEERERLAAKLANPSFTERAPAEVVERTRQDEAALAERLAVLRRNLEALG